LTFGNNYNKEIKENVLPKSLKKLSFGAEFNQKIKKYVLNEGLTHLYFGRYSKFNQKLDKDVLPKSLIKLELGQYYSYHIEDEVLPNSIEKIIIRRDDDTIERPLNIKFVLPNKYKYTISNEEGELFITKI
jgi:hypothetical protein